MDVGDLGGLDPGAVRFVAGDGSLDPGSDLMRGDLGADDDPGVVVIVVVRREDPGVGVVVEVDGEVGAARATQDREPLGGSLGRRSDEEFVGGDPERVSEDRGELGESSELDRGVDRAQQLVGGCAGHDDAAGWNASCREPMRSSTSLPVRTASSATARAVRRSTRSASRSGPVSATTSARAASISTA